MKPFTWKKKHHKMSILNTSFKIDSDNIDLIYEIGKGVSGRVYESKLKDTKQIVACKVITISTLNDKNLSKKLSKVLEMYSTPNGYDDFIRELNALKEIKGENILKLIGYSIQQVEHLTNLMILTENMEKWSLRLLLAKEPNLSYKIKLNISCDIASGISRIHELNYIHCDIRDDNILISNDYQAKVGDLGSVEQIDLRSGINLTKQMPPEYKTGVYDQKIDIFMFGLTLNRIYNGENCEDYYLTENHISILRDASCFSELIYECLNQNPKLRPTSNDLKCKLRKYRTEIDDFIKENYSNFEITNDIYIDLIQRVTILKRQNWIK